MGFVNTTFTIIIICLAVAAYILEMEGVTQGNTQKQQLVFGIPATYISFGIIMNAGIVIYLLFLIIWNSRKLSTSSIVIAFALLLGLFVLEIIVTVSNVRLPSSVITYIIITINFLIRMYYILEFQQTGITAITTTVADSSTFKKETPEEYIARKEKQEQERKQRQEEYEKREAERKEKQEEYERREAERKEKQEEYERREAKRMEEKAAWEAMTPEEKKAKAAADRAKKAESKKE